MFTLLAMTACAPETQVQAGQARVEGPEELRFEQVVIDTKASVELKFESLGVGDLKLLSATLEPDADPALEITSRSEQPVARGESGIVALSFAPWESGLSESALLVTTNDPDRPELRIPIQAEAVAPELDLDPETLWFGELTGGSERSLELSLHAKGQGTLRVSQLELSDPAFSYTLPQDYSLPLTLEPGQGITLSVRYQAQDSQPMDARLVVQSNAAEDPNQSVRLLANTGDAPGPPTAEITTPDWGMHFLSTETVALRGLAVDQGDAPQDLLVAWYANDSLIGTSIPDAQGKVSLDALLPAADALRLTLRVLDSDGESASDTVDLGVFVPGEPMLWRLSGGDTLFDFIVVDDDLQVSVDGELVLDDSSGSKSTHPPVEFTATPGDLLEILAIDVNYCQQSLTPLTLHWGSARSWSVTQAQCASACPEDACYDPEYGGPWPITFLDERTSIPTP